MFSRVTSFRSFLLVELLRITYAIFVDYDEILDTLYDSNRLKIKSFYVGPLFDIINNGTDVNFNCRKIFQKDIQSLSWTDIGYKFLVWPPPHEIPTSLLPSYTLDGSFQTINFS